MDVLSAKKLNSLLKKISFGDRDALRELYISMRMPIFIYIKSIVKEHHASEDITQQVFVEIMECACKYKYGSNAKAWIFTIARNLCMDHIKRSTKETPTDDQTIEYHSRHIELVSDNTFVYEALDRLDDIERQIVVLYIYVGMKQREIAEHLDLPYIKVRSIYGYAIRKLKRLYGGE